jgi:glycosyltransferase involved in cell wall biosynthesis
VTIYSLVWAPGVPEYAERTREARHAPGDLSLPTGIGPRDVLIIQGAVSFQNRWENLRTARRLQRQHPGLGVVVSDATWHPRSVSSESRAGLLRGALTLVEQRLLLSLDRRRTRYCFLTEEERQSFAQEAGVPLSVIDVTPFFPTIQVEDNFEELLAAAKDPEPYVFAGGNAMRDYDLLREALGSTDIPVRVATENVASHPPANFTEGPVPHREFLRLMASAQIVIMTLNAASKRSAGQQSYLNAMRLGKPTIVNDAIGVRDLTDGGAFVVPARDPVALREKVRWVLDPANAVDVAEVVARGVQLTTNELTQRRYYMQLVQVAEELAG